jgi:hypothetical protein
VHLGDSAGRQICYRVNINKDINVRARNSNQFHQCIQCGAKLVFVLEIIGYKSDRATFPLFCDD